MNTFYIYIIASYSVSIAALIGLYRLKRILPSFKPFILLLWVALLNEVVSYAMMKIYKTNALNSNIYIIVEYVIIMWQFKRWRSFKNNRIFIAVLGLGIALWAFDNFIIHSPWAFNSVFRTVYSSAIVFLSLQQISAVLVFERRNIFYNSKFIICSAFLIYYAFKSFIEAFYVFDLHMPNSFYHNIFLLLVLTNFLANLIFAFATLWIPTKQKFSLPY